MRPAFVAASGIIGPGQATTGTDTSETMPITRRERAPSDAELVRDCVLGHDEAWEALIRRFRRLIYSIAVSYRLGDAGADDVFQRVAIKLLQNLPKLRKVESLPSWIGAVTRHECQALRRESRHEDPAGLEGAPEPAEGPVDLVEEALEVERQHAVALAFEKLGEPCHGLLHALYREQPTPSYSEIAARTGRPIGSLGPTRARCLQKLQKLYLEAGGLPLG